MKDSLFMQRIKIGVRDFGMQDGKLFIFLRPKQYIMAAPVLQMLRLNST